MAKGKKKGGNTVFMCAIGKMKSEKLGRKEAFAACKKGAVAPAGK